LIEGGQVEVEAEEMEEVVRVAFLVRVPKKYEEPESWGGAADFLLGVEMERDPRWQDNQEHDNQIKAWGEGGRMCNR